jgi:hypothetical protein
MSNVHIVAIEWESDQVLARLARALVEHTGWTIDTEPDPKAALNYFFPYLNYSQKHLDYTATPTAAYFSHHDTASPEKSRWWHEAAGRVDLRIVTAKLYGKALRRHGLTAYCHAPVDLGMFTPMPRQSQPAKPVVGVSGMVYRDGRKGEQMIAGIAQDTRKLYEWKASGRGWAVNSIHWYEWEDLPKFYQGLNVLVCASTIEGVPMPPLEALACGIPVVIPKGVGMLDELPNTPGIHRYKKGDPESLKEALARAVDMPYDPDQLREVVLPWSVDAWVEDHITAMTDLLDPDLNLKTPLADWHGRSGVYIVAYGDPARNCAKRSISSWQRHNPDVPVALVSNAKLGPEDMLVMHPDADIGARKAKIKIYDLAPNDWEYVLYLDADTETIAPVQIFFDLLQDGMEFVICKNPVRFHTTRFMTRPDNIKECDETYEVMGSDDQIQLNGGVFAFRRCERVQRFFKVWYDEWNRYGKRDQAALLRALWQQPLRMVVLGNEWNTVTRYYEPEMSAGILHYPMEARRWDGTIDGRLDSAEAWKKVKK